MPNLPIVDSHVHLWDPAHFRMSWLDNNPSINKPFGVKEYDQATAGLDIVQMVYLQVDVEPAYGLLEAQWVADLARTEPRLAGMVPYAPLEDGDRVRSYLDALVAISPLSRGIRRLLQGESDPNFSTRPDFIRGVQLLADYGLSFDLCITHGQMPSAIRMARACPDVPIVLDHLGKPPIRNRGLEPWRSELAELASLPHVVCKISGAVTEADPENWQPDDLAPYILHALDVFGEDRVMFGGDWPVATLASSYRRWVDALDQITADLGESAKRKLWAENARRFYRLESVADADSR